MTLYSSTLLPLLCGWRKDFVWISSLVVLALLNATAHAIVPPFLNTTLVMREQRQVFRRHVDRLITAADMFNSNSKQVIDNNADGARSVYAIDVDGDGDVDILSASQNSDTVALYLSDGASPPVFAKLIIDNNADATESVYAIDVDGD